MARVGILTLPLHVNYGGILQAAALYRLLKDEGFDPVLMRKEPENAGTAKRLIRDLLRAIPGQNIGGVRQRAKARKTHEPFVRRFMPNFTAPCHNRQELRAAAEQWQLDALVVGSDQVWRSEYHLDNHYPVYFLNFVPRGIRKLSYAASFGHSDWRYPDHREEVSRLLSEFDAVSVREQSGTVICRDVLGREDCQLVLDPTLVVDPAFYSEAAAPALSKSQPSLLTYVLDQSDIADVTTVAVGQALPGNYATTSLAIDWNGTQAEVGEWLRSFMDADFVITDSYHGTIFSILFGKQFLAIGNRDRGLDRFTTLLDALSLTDRLVLDANPERIAPLVNRPIDYFEVNDRLTALRRRSRDFLLSALGNGPMVSEPPVPGDPAVA
jgi:hypothetical protein